MIFTFLLETKVREKNYSYVPSLLWLDPIYHSIGGRKKKEEEEEEKEADGV